MARSDLLISLVKASSSGDRQEVQRTVETIIAEERAKHHNVLADRLMRALRTNGNGHHKSVVDPSSRISRDFIAEIVPRLCLGELILQKAVEEHCRQLIGEQRRSDVLRAHSLNPRHRVLLVGPPGNGKTSLAEAIAEALAVPFLVVRYESIIGSFLGETAGRLKRVFDYARTTPCVLFFDEFDTVGKERGDAHETGEIKRVVSSLLMQIDELPSYTVVVAATNHAELLDRAAWRRFQLRLEMPAPTNTELKRYFDGFLGGLGEKPVSTERLVKVLGPLSYAEAEEFCLDVRRWHALGLGERTWNAAFEEQLRLWRVRVAAPQNQNKELDDARKASSCSATSHDGAAAAG